MARVYVSSTVKDLKTERKAVFDWLVAANHQPVHSCRPDSETVRVASWPSLAKPCAIPDRPSLIVAFTSRSDRYEPLQTGRVEHSGV